MEQNIKSLLYNHLVYICAKETDFWQFYDIILPDKTENSLWHSSQLRVIIESVWHIVTLILFGNNYADTQRKFRCVLSWNNTNHVICWDKSLVFFHQHKVEFSCLKHYQTFNCNAWSTKYTWLLNKRNNRTKTLNKIVSRS